MNGQDLDRLAARDARRLVSLGRSRRRLERDLDAPDAPWATVAEDGLPGADQRLRALHLLDRVLDHQVAYDAVARLHLGSWKIAPWEDGPRQARHFVLGSAAYLGRLSLGLSLVGHTLRRGTFERLLDEGAAALGIPAGAYDLLRADATALEHVGRVAAAGQYTEWLAGSELPALRADVAMEKVLRDLDRLLEGVGARLTRDAPRLVLGGALEVLRGVAKAAFFPVQAHVAEWLGDTRVLRDGALIAPAQIAEAAAACRTGDLLLERRNWYLSNVGLPGFWPHTALWLGTPSSAAALLDSDPEVRAAYGGSFVEAIARRLPEPFAHWRSADEAGHPRVVIEAVSEGVVCASAEHSLAADYAAALRPRTSPLEIARAVERALENVGRPYDFDFDFATDTALVCSELVYKAWEPRVGVRGLAFELEEILGRPTLTPNGIVAQLDRLPLELVWFLDGSEEEGTARFGDLEAFRASHRRPKWDFAQR